MKISLDAGALCAPDDNQFGNYTFTYNLVRAIAQYGKKHQYFLYSFCNKDRSIILSRNMIFKRLRPRLFWSKVRVGVEEVFRRKDLYLALNQSIPLMTFSNIISFSHGLSFKFYKGLYRNYDTLNEQLEEMVKNSDRIVVSSKRVKNEMAEIYPKIDKKIIVIPFGIPFDMPPPERRVKKEEYFLHVGMDHPIKNVQFIINAFKKFKKSKKYRDFKLILAGYTRKINDKSIVTIPFVERGALKKMYQKATALLTASHYESFNLPVLEALSQKTQVIGLRGAIIPELRPYVRSADDIEEFIELMKKSVTKPLRVKRHLTKDFSWKNYIKELEKAYEL